VEPLYAVDRSPRTLPEPQPHLTDRTENAALILPAEDAPAVESLDTPRRPVRVVVVPALAVGFVLVLATLFSRNGQLPTPVALTDPAPPGALSTPGALSSGSASTDPPVPQGRTKPLGSSARLRVGRHSLHGAGVPRLTFSVPSDGWEQFGGLYVSKDTNGSQAAEAIIFWTGVNRSKYAQACGQWWGSPGGTLADWAAHVSRARGTDLIAGPTQVTVGGRTAQHVVLSVRKDVACNPGLFHRWKTVQWGPFWDGIDIGDTSRVWLVEVGGKILYMEADTHQNAGLDLEREVQQIVGSIDFP
jgi:hypothetical protein